MFPFIKTIDGIFVYDVFQYIFVHRIHLLNKTFVCNQAIYSKW